MEVDTHHFKSMNDPYSDGILSLYFIGFSLTVINGLAWAVMLVVHTLFSTL